MPFLKKKTDSRVLSTKARILFFIIAFLSVFGYLFTGSHRYYSDDEIIKQGIETICEIKRLSFSKSLHVVVEYNVQGKLFYRSQYPSIDRTYGGGYNMC
jgi:hypothetical protein